jgi:hypothetical protein
VRGGKNDCGGRGDLVSPKGLGREDTGPPPERAPRPFLPRLTVVPGHKWRRRFAWTVGIIVLLYAALVALGFLLNIHSTMGRWIPISLILIVVIALIARRLYSGKDLDKDAKSTTYRNPADGSIWVMDYPPGEAHLPRLRRQRA